MNFMPGTPLRTIHEERLVKRVGPYQVWETEEAYEVRAEFHGRRITSGPYTDFAVTRLAVRQCERRLRDWYCLEHDKAVFDCAQDSEN